MTKNLLAGYNPLRHQRRHLPLLKGGIQLLRFAQNDIFVFLSVQRFLSSLTLKADFYIIKVVLR